MQPIYLDYLATTPVDEAVVAAMTQALVDLPGNASSNTHVYGWEAQEAVSLARAHVASLIGVDERALVWTSGATEANNLALLGAAYQYQRQGKHIVTTQIEHASVLACCKHLEQQGFEVTYLPPNSEGLLDPEQVSGAVRPDTLLVSVMHVNNELGVIQPIAEIGEALRDKGVLFHVDAAQSLGKIPIDFSELNIDLMSLSAHKCYGPKGIGALVVRTQPRVQLQPLIHGGGQQKGLRSGTVATHQVVGFGKACELASGLMDDEMTRLQHYRERLSAMLSGYESVHLYGHPTKRLPGALHFAVERVDAEVLIKAMPELALSTGSACQAEAAEPSHVLSAIGLTPAQAQSCVRLCFGRFTTTEQVDRVCAVLEKTISSFKN